MHVGQGRCLRIRLRRSLSVPVGPKVSVRIPVTSAPGLDRSQICDWMTGLSASQPWPADVGGVCGGRPGVEIREVSGFDKGRQDGQVSESEPLCLILSPALSPASTIYYQTRTRRRIRHAPRLYHE